MPDVNLPPLYDYESEHKSLDSQQAQWQREHEMFEAKNEAQMKLVELEIAQALSKVEELQARKKELKAEKQRQDIIQTAREHVILYHQSYLDEMQRLAPSPLTKGG